MSDTVELWTLRDENADLRRQLAEAQRQRDEVQATCAGKHRAAAWFATHNPGEPVPDWIDQWMSPHFSGRDFLARLETAQRTAQAADGLVEALDIPPSLRGMLKVAVHAKLRGDDSATVTELLEWNDKINAALAAYQATKEQK